MTKEKEKQKELLGLYTHIVVIIRDGKKNLRSGACQKTSKAE
jgi:hypothetical protein